ncbi:DUF3048 N-terminal domain-containing protein [Rossellomorea sp. H39__3]
MLVRFMAIAISVLTLVACSSNQPTNPTDNEDAVPVSEDKTGAESHSPLTGEVQDEGDGRSIAVMINNHPKARPQSGLSKADIVYEILAEGNITRFLAIFQSERPENVGPVRSARDYYISLAKGYDSLFIAHGYSPDAKKILQGGSVDNLNGISYDGTLFKRASSRKAPHNSYITFENIKKGADDLGMTFPHHPRISLSRMIRQKGRLQALSWCPIRILRSIPLSSITVMKANMNGIQQATKPWKTEQRTPSSSRIC